MGLEISKIADTKLQQIAAENDNNQNGKLEKEEYNVFQKAAQGMLEKGEVTEENYTQAVKQYHAGFIGWLKEDSMVCKDTKDDGKIGLGQAALNVGQGLAGGIVKGVVQNPIKSAIGIAAGVGLTVLTGGAILPVMIVAGLVAGGAITVKSAVDASKSTTDADKKKAFENVGTGASVVLLSALGIHSATKTAANAGVKSLQGLENESLLTKVKAGVKATPEIFKVSGMNAKGNILTWTSAIKGDKIIYANSNETRTGVMVGKQSGNPVEDAYKVDLKGSVEEVLAKNPGLSYDAEAGKFYVQTAWGSKSYVSDNYMFVKYGMATDANGQLVPDINAVEGAEFYDTYISAATKQATGKNSYIDPEKLAPGEHVLAQKEAPARFKVVPEGTKYVSAETAPGKYETLPAGRVLRIDGQGRPYNSKVDWMLKKVELTDAQVGALVKADPALAATTPKGQAYLLANDPATLIKTNPEAYLKSQGVEITKQDFPSKIYSNTIDKFYWSHNGEPQTPICVRDEGNVMSAFAKKVFETLNK